MSSPRTKIVEPVTDRNAIQRLVILGSYGIRVRQGQATIAGAILVPSETIHWVHAPHCHALPILRATSDALLELHPHPAAQTMRKLARLNPAFGKLWNETTDEPPSGKQNKTTSTFQIVRFSCLLLQPVHCSCVLT